MIFLLIFFILYLPRFVLLLAQDCNLCVLHLIPLQMLQITEVAKLTKYIPSVSRNLISCTHKVQSYYKSTNPPKLMAQPWQYCDVGATYAERGISFHAVASFTLRCKTCLTRSASCERALLILMSPCCGINWRNTGRLEPNKSLKTLLHLEL